MPRVTLAPAEMRLIDLLDEMNVDTIEFVEALEQAQIDGRKHPLTVAAARIESASFETSIERGEISVIEPTF